jgi:hypothetical protein
MVVHTAVQDRVLAAHDRLCACATESARWVEAVLLMGEIGVDWVTAGTAARGRANTPWRWRFGTGS